MIEMLMIEIREFITRGVTNVTPDGSRHNLNNLGHSLDV
jgi:hypothetical protein